MRTQQGLFKRIALGLLVWAACAVSSLSFAKDYKYFSIEMPDNWIEYWPEKSMENKPNYRYVCFMADDLKSYFVILSFADNYQFNLKPKEKNFFYAAMAKRILEDDFSASYREYVSDGDYYRILGTMCGRSSEMRIFVEGNLFFFCEMIGPKRQEAVDSLKTIKINYAAVQAALDNHPKN